MLAALFKKIAPRIGARVLLEPEWGIAGQITFKKGTRSYFRFNSIDLNTLGASEIAKDKDYAAFFMRRMGYPAIRGKAFYSETWAKTIRSPHSTRAALVYARTLGFPVVVKPNSQSQGVAVHVAHSTRECRAALAAVFALDKVALVQPLVHGRDYRIVVLDTEVISAYERIPLHVVGDGVRTIAQLLARKEREFKNSGRDTQLKLDDARMHAKLSRFKRSLDSIPAHGERVYLLDNANLSSGGDAHDVTSELHPGFKKLAVKLTADMGLRLCGVDILVDGDITAPPKKFNILEINSAPGLDHYATSGTAQQKIVEDLYLKVLRHMAR